MAVPSLVVEHQKQGRGVNEERQRKRQLLQQGRIYIIQGLNFLPPKKLPAQRCFALPSSLMSSGLENGLDRRRDLGLDRQGSHGGGVGGGPDANDRAMGCVAAIGDPDLDSDAQPGPGRAGSHASPLRFADALGAHKVDERRVRPSLQAVTDAAIDLSPMPYESSLAPKEDQALSVLMATSLTTTTDAQSDKLEVGKSQHYRTAAHSHPLHAFEDYTKMSKAARARVKKDQRDQSKRNDLKIATQCRKIKTNDGDSGEMPTAQELLRMIGLSEGGRNPSNNVVASALCFLERTIDTLKVGKSVDTVHPTRALTAFHFTRPTGRLMPSTNA